MLLFLTQVIVFSLQQGWRSAFSLAGFALFSVLFLGFSVTACCWPLVSLSGVLLDCRPIGNKPSHLTSLAYLPPLRADIPQIYHIARRSLFVYSSLSVAKVCTPWFLSCDFTTMSFSSLISSLVGEEVEEGGRRSTILVADLFSTQCSISRNETKKSQVQNGYSRYAYPTHFFSLLSSLICSPFLFSRSIVVLRASVEYWWLTWFEMLRSLLHEPGSSHKPPIQPALSLRKEEKCPHQYLLSWLHRLTLRTHRCRSMISRLVCGRTTPPQILRRGNHTLHRWVGRVRCFGS